MRSIWAGAISFGLVVIPVKLYAATEQRDITFRQVHRKDGARIQFRRFCTLDGEEVPYSDIAKGYELPTGDMVVLTDEDLADLPLVTAHRIEVLHFAPAAQVEPIYAAKSYYTEPDPTGARAYVLFRDALEASGKVAVAKVALRQREALAALRVRERVITLETLLWPDEVRKPDFAFLDEDIEVRSQELGRDWARAAAVPATYPYPGLTSAEAAAVSQPGALSSGAYRKARHAVSSASATSSALTVIAMTTRT